MISGAKNGTGTIFSASSTLQHIFGYNPIEVIGKNVSFLGPRCYNKLHDDFIAKKINSRRKIMEHRSISNFGVHQNGYIFPIRILNSVYPLINQGIMLWGTIRQEKLAYDFLIINSENEIDCFTKTFGDTLNLIPKERYLIKNLSKKLYRICRYFDKIMNQYKHQNPNESRSEYSQVDMSTVIKEADQTATMINKQASEANSDTEKDISATIREVTGEGKLISFKPAKQASVESEEKEKYFYHCRLEAKDYNGKVIKILTMDRKPEFEKVASTITLRSIGAFLANKRKKGEEAE